MATELGSKDGILIRIMKLEDYKELKIFMGNNFYNAEPLCASSGEDVQKCDEKENDDYHMSMIEQGTCLLALDVENGGRTVGFVLAGIQEAGAIEQHRKEAEAMDENTWGRISRLLSKAEVEANLFERYGVSQLLYSHMTNVSPAMRGKGLGTRLAAALMEVGRSKGIPLMSAFCSSYYSGRQKQAMGMECVHSLAYADYKINGEVIFKPPAPHTHLRILAIKL